METYIKVILVSLIIYLLTRPKCNLYEPLAMSAVASQITGKIKSGNKVVVNFNTEWCDHSKEIQAMWDELVTANPGKVYDMKCENDEREYCTKVHDVDGFPTILRFNYPGDSTREIEFQDESKITVPVREYRGPRQKNKMEIWIRGEYLHGT